ncbi:MAG: alpha-amylase family glycosyl hydrolase, partial [Bryobacteraceae bacterium]
SDYTNVAREYGTMEDWNRLTAEAKKRGIRVLVDFVVNHTSDQHAWFKESRSSRSNPKRDWYVWKDGGGPDKPPTHWTSIFGGYTWTWDARTKQWYYHMFLPEQPDVNWRNPQLKKAMFDVVRFWLDHGASGFRLDATPYLIEDPSYPDDPHPPAPGGTASLMPYNSGRPENHQILKEMRQVLNGYPGDPVLLGESSTKTIQDLAAVYGKNGDEIHLPMNFLIGNLQTLNAAIFKREVDAAHTQLGGHTAVFFFSNHDHPRQWSSFGDGANNDQIAKVTAALTLSQPGTVLLYYGEELGMATMSKDELSRVPITPKRPRADRRDGARTPMQWDTSTNAGFSKGSPWLPVESTYKTYNVASEKAVPDSIYNWYSALIRLRRSEVTLRDGAYLPLISGNTNVYAFGRKTAAGDIALVAMNTTNKEQRVNISGFDKWPRFDRVLLASPSIQAPRLQQFTIPPYGVFIAAGK